MRLQPTPAEKVPRPSWSLSKLSRFDSGRTSSGTGLPSTSTNFHWLPGSPLEKRPPRKPPPRERPSSPAPPVCAQPASAATPSTSSMRRKPAWRTTRKGDSNVAIEGSPEETDSRSCHDRGGSPIRTSSPMHAPPNQLVVRRIGLAPYLPTLEAMRAYTRDRDPGSPDEVWLLEHPPVFTQGFAGDAGFVHDTGAIPVVTTDRGGQVTYHGPGQLVAYLLVDLRRRRLGVRDFVCLVEQAVIDYLASVGIAATRRDRAPGVYVRDARGSGAKIASIG